MNLLTHLKPIELILIHLILVLPMARTSFTITPVARDTQNDNPEELNGFAKIRSPTLGNRPATQTNLTLTVEFLNSHPSLRSQVPIGDTPPFP